MWEEVHLLLTAHAQALEGLLCVVRPGQALHHPCNTSGAGPARRPAQAQPRRPVPAPPHRAAQTPWSGRRQRRQAYGGHLQRRACPANKVVT